MTSIKRRATAAAIVATAAVGSLGFGFQTAAHAADKAAVDTFGLDLGNKPIADCVISRARPERDFGAEALGGTGGAGRHARGDLDTIRGDELALVHGQRVEAKNRVEGECADAQQLDRFLHLASQPA